MEMDNAAGELFKQLLNGQVADLRAEREALRKRIDQLERENRSLWLAHAKRAGACGIYWGDCKTAAVTGTAPDDVRIEDANTLDNEADEIITALVELTPAGAK